MEPTQEIKGMPAGAFEVLPPGKEYVPYIPADRVIPEVSIRSIILGIIMAAVFSAAAAFSGLKIGQVFEAAIPIAIIAVGLSNSFARRSTILENVIIQSIGAASGVVVAGAIFTLPAIFIFGLDKKIGVDLVKIFLVSFIGGSLGILFLIPFRKYFVQEMHGQFPFPEATATTQILVTGEQGGSQSRILVKSMLIGAGYDFLVHTVRMFSEVFTTGMDIFKWGKYLQDKAKLVLKFDALSMVVGLGYIIGLRYSAVIVAGSLLSWLVLVPGLYHLREFIPVAFLGSAGGPLDAMTATEIFKWKVRFIGIGAIAMAGFIGIVKSSNVIVQAFGMGFKQLFHKKDDSAAAGVKRTQLDLSMKSVILLLGMFLLVILVFFRYFILNNMTNAWQMSLIALATVFVISFLFTTVAARAIAITGNNPVSGMTLMTLIISSVILVSAGLKGDYGMLAVLMIGGVVCTSLSMSGGFITDLKIGYWLGATPLKQQKYKFIGTLVAALCVGGVMLILNKTYGFDTTVSANALAAPQANAMATVIQALMAPNAQMPWYLLISGAVIAVIVNFLKIPTLAFALGMYLPLELNTPLLIGGFVAHLLMKSSEDKALATKRYDRGLLIASGFIAGGALIGVVDAILKIARIDRFLNLDWADKLMGQPLAMVMFIGLVLYLYFDSRRAKMEE